MDTVKYAKEKEQKYMDILSIQQQIDSAAYREQNQI